jgi:hypothetical protein
MELSDDLTKSDLQIEGMVHKIGDMTMQVYGSDSEKKGTADQPTINDSTSESSPCLASGAPRTSTPCDRELTKLNCSERGAIHRKVHLGGRKVPKEVYAARSGG